MEQRTAIVTGGLRGLGRAMTLGLARTGVRGLLSREPSLEELFLAQYGPDGAAPVLTGVAPAGQVRS